MILYFLLPKPHLETRKRRDRELRILLESMDTDPHRSESDLRLLQIVTQIEEIILRPERGDIDSISRRLDGWMVGWLEKRGF